MLKKLCFTECFFIVGKCSVRKRQFGTVGETEILLENKDTQEIEADIIYMLYVINFFRTCLPAERFFARSSLFLLQILLPPDDIIAMGHSVNKSIVYTSFCSSILSNLIFPVTMSQ